jgi:hypothetical protein
MSMTEDVKARLRELGAAKRDKVKLLKDCEPGEFAVAVDYCEERLGLSRSLRAGDGLCYLKYASPEQIKAMQGACAWVRRLVQQPGPSPRMVEKVCFGTTLLGAVLRFLVGDGRHKYMTRGWDARYGAYMTVMKSDLEAK